MQTQCLLATPESIAEAGRMIQAGELVAFPTETVYGLGADGMNPEAVSKIFAAKGRPADNPLILHIARPSQVEGIAASVPAFAQKAMDTFWPGPLTVVLPATAAVPKEVTAGLSTVAVRLPAHPVAQALLEAAGCPVAAPSANRSGRPSPTRAEDVLLDLSGQIPLVLDGGSCGVGVESTVLDCTGAIPCVLRPGGVTKEMLEGVLGSVEVDPSALRELSPLDEARSPGMRHRHYAPKASMTVFLGPNHAVTRAIARRAVQIMQEEAGRPVILATTENLPAYGGLPTVLWGSHKKTDELAQRLYVALRQMDAMGATHILAEGIGTEGMGLAVMNRLLRAAGFHVVNVG